MKKVLLDFRHETFDDLSERSVRQFMRKVATAVRRAQLEELSDFVFAQDLEYADRRSIADRLANASRDAPAYFVERIEKGSLTAVFAVGVVLLAVLARAPIIDLIDDGKRRRRLLRNLRRFAKRDWARAVANAIADQLSGQELGSHIVADRIRVKERKARIVVEVRLVTERSETDPPPRPADTFEMLRREIDRRIDDLDLGEG